MTESMLLLILFTIVLQQVRGYSPINHAWTNHFVALLFFYLRILSISAHRNNLFLAEYRHTMAFFDLSQCTNPACHLSLLPCVLFSIFFCSRYSALFSMERLLPEWMPQALWVLKEVSLLRQCVDSPHLSLRLTFGAFISLFFWDFPLTCKRWSVSPLGQAAQCLILLSMSLMHSMQPQVLRLHYFKCLMGKYFRSASYSYSVCCCFKP